MLAFLESAISETGFKPKLVSSADEVKVIHASIVENIGTNQMVVCDVSGKNPNVMLELGMRLVFNLPVIIIRDEQTEYEFDIGLIEHLEYPRDLRFNKTKIFREKLIEKIRATNKAAASPNYISFLDNFKKVKPGKIEEEIVTNNEYVIQSIDRLSQEIKQLKKPEDETTANLLKNSVLGALVENFIGEYLFNEKLKSVSQALDLDGGQAMKEYVIWNATNSPYGFSISIVKAELMYQLVKMGVDNRKNL